MLRSVMTMQKSLMQIWPLFYQKEIQFTKRRKEIKILLSDLEEEVENLKKDKRKLMHKQLKIDELGCITRFYPKKTVLMSQTQLKHFLVAVIRVNILLLPVFMVLQIVSSQIFVVTYPRKLLEILGIVLERSQKFFFKLHWPPSIPRYKKPRCITFSNLQGCISMQTQIDKVQKNKKNILLTECSPKINGTWYHQSHFT